MHDPKRIYVITPDPAIRPDWDHELLPADTEDDYHAACRRAREVLDTLMDATDDEPEFTPTVDLRDATDEDREILRGDHDQ